MPKRETFDGSGSFTDENGKSAIYGNTIVHKWNNQATKFLMFFSLGWNAFNVVFWYLTWNGPVTVNDRAYPTMQHALDSNAANYIFFIFPLVGILMAYVTIALKFNKTKVEYSYKGLEISRGPFPWPKRHEVISHKEITQCYVEGYVSHTYNNRPVGAFRVVGIRMNGPEIIIMKGLQNYRDARIFEQWLERKLSIDDKPVKGEVA